MNILQSQHYVATNSLYVVPPPVPNIKQLEAQAKIQDMGQNENTPAKQKLEDLEERLQAIEGTDVYGNIYATQLCLVLDLIIPAKFKVLEFDKYDGSSCPRNHLIMYCRKIVAHIGEKSNVNENPRPNHENRKVNVVDGLVEKCKDEVHEIMMPMKALKILTVYRGQEKDEMKDSKICALMDEVSEKEDSFLQRPLTVFYQESRISETTRSGCYKPDNLTVPLDGLIMGQGRKNEKRNVKEHCKEQDVEMPIIAKDIEYKKLVTDEEENEFLKIVKQSLGHTKALHIQLKCKDYVIARVLVDNGSTLNIMPKSTLLQLPMDMSHIKSSNMVVKAFAGKSLDLLRRSGVIHVAVDEVKKPHRFKVEIMTTRIMREGYSLNQNLDTLLKSPSNDGRFGLGYKPSIYDKIRLQEENKKKRLAKLEMRDFDPSLKFIPVLYDTFKSARISYSSNNSDLKDGLLTKMESLLVAAVAQEASFEGNIVYACPPDFELNNWDIVDLPTFSREFQE
ncbi:Gag-pro-like protein [Cucumis melo var. makuwa]|uniref:Gag-pro-like protein n=1 Tax=Cucumis melo var. makuwa TaxID=1194695 RepID=A0A5A7V6I2_CUCMM|nr:Gag-pro-like protein [Cucumis melo var. makuwa]TYK13470.1 Gag-pro-like protein [Cucumis melo var. makuwa]